MRKPIITIDDYKHHRSLIAEFLADSLLDDFISLAAESLIVFRMNGNDVTARIGNPKEGAPLYWPLVRHLENWLDEATGYKERPLAKLKRKALEMLHR
jgi:hypothetical protein